MRDFTEIKENYNYLIWREKNGFFYAVDRWNKISIWSTISGKLIYCKRLDDQDSFKDPHNYQTMWRFTKIEQDLSECYTLQSNSNYSINILQNLEVKTRLQVVKLQVYGDTYINPYSGKTEVINIGGKAETLFEFDLEGFKYER